MLDALLGRRQQGEDAIEIFCGPHDPPPQEPAPLPGPFYTTRRRMGHAVIAARKSSEGQGRTDRNRSAAAGSLAAPSDTFVPGNLLRPDEALDPCRAVAGSDGTATRRR